MKIITKKQPLLGLGAIFLASFSLSIQAMPNGPFISNYAGCTNGGAGGFLTFKKKDGNQYTNDYEVIGSGGATRPVDTLTVRIDNLSNASGFGGHFSTGREDGYGGRHVECHLIAGKNKNGNIVASDDISIDVAGVPSGGISVSAGNVATSGKASNSRFGAKLL